MLSFAAAFALALASLFGSVSAEAPVTEYQPYNAPAEVNPFEGMTAAECGELPDYQSTKDCALALWDMDALDLPACAEEDTADCYWISRGGFDFIDINGFAYFLPKVLEA